MPPGDRLNGGSLATVLLHGLCCGGLGLLAAGGSLAGLATAVNAPRLLAILLPLPLLGAAAWIGLRHRARRTDAGPVRSAENGSTP